MTEKNEAADRDKSEEICSYDLFKSPALCTGDECNYIASWEYNKVTQDVSFSIKAKQYRNKWTGIGFTPVRKMVSTELAELKKVLNF